jgi:hypothetical protein
MAKPITNRLKNSKTPVIRKDLEGGVIAEANNDGSIYVDKSVKKGSPLEKEAIAHEKVHLDQMKRGDLNYDDNNVYWKGKAYPRLSMNEGAKNLPWEKEAYNKTEHMNKKKKSSAMKMSDADLVANNSRTYSRFNNAGDSMTKGYNSTLPEEEGTPITMKASPITAKAKQTNSPLHRTVAVQELMDRLDGGGDKVKGINEPTGEYGTFTSTTTKDIARGFSGGDIEAARGGSPQATDQQGYMAGIRKRFPYTTAADLASKKYIHKGRIAEMDAKYPASKAPDSEGGASETATASFTQDQIKVPGTPGTRGKYNMGYYETRNARMAENVRRRDDAQDERQFNRDIAKYERKSNKGKKLYNPKTGKQFKDAAEYAQYRAKSASANYDAEIGTITDGTTSTLPSQKGATKDDTVAKGAKSYKIVDNKIVNVDKPTLLGDENALSLSQQIKLDAAKKKLSPAGMNPSNVNKTAFKMKGYGSKYKK